MYDGQRICRDEEFREMVASNATHSFIHKGEREGRKVILSIFAFCKVDKREKFYLPSQICDVDNRA